MTKIKICGLKRTEDISYVNELLPDFAGFVFAKSSRQVDAKKAAELKKQLSPKIKAVGVFVKRFEAFTLDSGEMYEYIVSVFTCDKSVTFFSVEPFYCTFVHDGTSVR